MRRYLAEYDDGHDFGKFEYWSDHRNGSAANHYDAEQTFIRHHGLKRFKQITIIRTYLQRD